MRLRKMFLALVACLAVAAMAASAAQAQWTVVKAGTTLVGKESVAVSGGPFTLTAELLGLKLVVTASHVECTPGVECEIDNLIGTDHSAGGLTFTGVTVDKPLHCTVSSPGEPDGTVTTKALTDEVIMDPTVGSTAVFDKFFPETGTKFVELEFESEPGAECTLEGLNVPVEGTLTGEAVHETATVTDIPTETGELYRNQGVTFSESLQKTGGGLLYLSGNKAKPAYLDGTADNELDGARAGEPFGADE